jgi:hypothetical protein
MSLIGKSMSCAVGNRERSRHDWDATSNPHGRRPRAGQSEASRALPPRQSATRRSAQRAAVRTPRAPRPCGRHQPLPRLDRSSPSIRHCDEFTCGAGLLGSGVSSAYARSAWGASADACRSTTDGRNPSTAGGPTSPCCSAGTANAYRSFDCFGNRHTWRRDRTTGKATTLADHGRLSDQSAARAVVRSGRTPARTNSS